MEGSTSSTPGLATGYSVRGSYLVIELCTPAQYAASACQQYTCFTCVQQMQLSRSQACSHCWHSISSRQHLQSGHIASFASFVWKQPHICSCQAPDSERVHNSALSCTQ